MCIRDRNLIKGNGLAGSNTELLNINDIALRYFVLLTASCNNRVHVAPPIIITRQLRCPRIAQNFSTSLCGILIYNRDVYKRQCEFRSHENSLMSFLHHMSTDQILIIDCKTVHMAFTLKSDTGARIPRFQADRHLRVMSQWLKMAVAADRFCYGLLINCLLYTSRCV